MYKLQKLRRYSQRCYNRIIHKEEVQSTESCEINFTTEIKRETKFVTWSIENINMCPLETGEYLESPSFRTGFFNVTQWRLRLYPKGRNGRNASKAGLFLYRMNSGLKVFIEFNLCIFSADREEVIQFSDFVVREDGNYASKEYCQESNEFGKDDWMDSEFLLSLKVVKINCGLIVGYLKEADDNESCISGSPTFNCNCTLSNDFEELYNSGTHSDVILDVGKKQFHVHKAILGARSKVFTAMFENRMKESETNVVSIEDIDSDIMSSVLQHIYTGKIDNMTVDKAIQLFQVAEKYALTQLQKECIRAMLENMTVDNVCRIAVLADIHSNSATQLKDATNYFFRNYAPQIFEKEEWKALVSDRQLLASEIIKNVVSDYKTKCSPTRSST